VGAVLWGQRLRAGRGNFALASFAFAFAGFFPSLLSLGVLADSYM